MIDIQRAEDVEEVEAFRGSCPAVLLAGRESLVQELPGMSTALAWSLLFFLLGWI